ncbi:MAG: hypothetical protein ABIR24_11315 [Verrucomicrobiota bacterium]
MTELKQLIKEHRLVINQRSSTTQMRDHAQKQIDEVVDEGDITTPKAQKKLSDAKFSLDLAVASLKVIEKQLPKLESRILGLYDAERSAFNKRVKARREKEIADIKESNRRFFNGKERLLCDLVAKNFFPAIREINRAIAEMPFNPGATDEMKVAWAEQFISSAEKSAKQLGLE